MIIGKAVVVSECIDRVLVIVPGLQFQEICQFQVGRLIAERLASQVQTGNQKMEAYARRRGMDEAGSV